MVGEAWLGVETRFRFLPKHDVRRTALPGALCMLAYLYDMFAFVVL